MFARKVALSSRTLPSNGNGTLTFERANHRGDGIRGRYLNTPGHMVRHEVPLNNPTCLLSSQLMKNGPECVANVPKQGFTPSFGHEDHMIRAIPPGMGQALRGFGHGVLLGSAHQATR